MCDSDIFRGQMLFIVLDTLGRWILSGWNWLHNITSAGFVLFSADWNGKVYKKWTERFTDTNNDVGFLNLIRSLETFSTFINGLPVQLLTHARTHTHAHTYVQTHTYTKKLLLTETSRDSWAERI